MTDDSAPNLQDWLGNTERRSEMIAPAQAEGVAAMLDRTGPDAGVSDGAPLPNLWHWFYFLPRAPMSQVGHDGHPARGGFLPPVDLPRRMFAGARLVFHTPLTVGREAVRDGEIAAVSEKSGSSGRLVFVTVKYRIHQGETLCLEEEQDIVYRGAGGPVPAPEVLAPEALPALPEGTVVRTVRPDPVLLFRFSALTFNAHRIHYDRPYAMNEEGYPGLIVHGPLNALLLLTLAEELRGRPARRFSFRGRAPVFDLAPFRLLATPAADGDAVSLSVQNPDGAAALTADAGFA